jgi:hypothetical protein
MLGPSVLIGIRICSNGVKTSLVGVREVVLASARGHEGLVPAVRHERIVEVGRLGHVRKGVACPIGGARADLAALVSSPSVFGFVKGRQFVGRHLEQYAVYRRFGARVQKGTLSGAVRASLVEA